MSDALLEEIARHPGDDDARLVWADRAGGERGELVVIQCALARHDRPRGELAKLYARERELLDASKTWPETEGLVDPRFVRGFVAHATVTLANLPSLLARHPLLHSIVLSDARVDALPHQPRPDWGDTAWRIATTFGKLEPGRIHSVEASPIVWIDSTAYPETIDHSLDFIAVLQATHAGRALRRLKVATPIPERAAATGELTIEAIARFDLLEELQVVGTFGFLRWRDFLRRHSRLSRLGLLRAPHHRELPLLLHDPCVAGLTELDLGGGGLDDDQLRGLARSPHLANLTRLGISWSVASVDAFAELAASPHLKNLRTLDVSGPRLDDAKIAVLAKATFAPSLRVLTACDTKLTVAAAADLLSFPALEQLDLRTSYADARALHAALEGIPFVSC